MMRTYVVFLGKKPGLYSKWAECKENVDGFRGSVHCSYDTRDEAEAAYSEFCKEKCTLKECLRNGCPQCPGNLYLSVGNNKNNGTIGRHYYRCPVCRHVQWPSGARGGNTVLSEMKTYAVFAGKTPGVYSEWEECKENVDGFLDSFYCSYNNRKDAEAAYNEFCKGKSMLEKVGDASGASSSVDASASLQSALSALSIVKDTVDNVLKIEDLTKLENECQCAAEFEDKHVI